MKKINNFTINYLVIVTVPILITGLYAVINLPHMSLKDILSTYIALVWWISWGVIMHNFFLPPSNSLILAGLLILILNAGIVSFYTLFKSTENKMALVITTILAIESCISWYLLITALFSY